MLDMAAIIEDLNKVMDETAARKIAEVIEKGFIELRNTVTKDEFKELKDVVKELADAQNRTGARVEELAEAQNRIEARVEELAEAQNRTEARVDELGRTQKEGFQSLRDQIAALGGRWGIYNEGTFRSTIHGLLGKMEGIEICEGHYGGRQVDIIIRNGEHVILEIISRMHEKDIEKLYRSADDYKVRENIEPVLMVADGFSQHHFGIYVDMFRYVHNYFPQRILIHV